MGWDLFYHNETIIIVWGDVSHEQQIFLTTKNGRQHDNYNEDYARHF